MLIATKRILSIFNLDLWFQGHISVLKPSLYTPKACCIIVKAVTVVSYSQSFKVNAQISLGLDIYLCK